MGQIFWGVGSPGTVSTATGGKVSGATVGTVGAQVIAGNAARVSISFENPGSGSLFVYPVTNAAGAPNTPSNANPAGSFVVMPGAMLTISGECQLAWGSFAANASSPLTIMESNL
jgi:hypothetical protein